MVRSFGWLLAVALVGCGGEIKEKDWGAEYGQAVCEAYDECLRSYFLENYSDIEDCVDEYEEEYGADAYDDCDFDPEEARECIDAMKDFAKSCEYVDISDECDDVWDCSERRPRYTSYTEYGDTGGYRNAGCIDLRIFSGLSAALLFIPLFRRRGR